MMGRGQKNKKRARDCDEEVVRGAAGRNTNEQSDPSDEFCAKMFEMFKRVLNDESSTVNGRGTKDVISPIQNRNVMNSTRLHENSLENELKEKDEIIEKLKRENNKMRTLAFREEEFEDCVELHVDTEKRSHRNQPSTSNSKPQQRQQPSTSNSKLQQISPLFGFKDVEDSVSKFSGDDEYLIEKWIEDMEEAAECLGWNDLQKFVYGKRLLSGSAKQSLRMGKRIDNWHKLIEFLTTEFELKTNETLIHKRMQERKKKNGESFRSYLITMREIGALGCLSDDAIIQHCIDGIVDYEPNKSILYGAVSIHDFKLKLDQYETIKKKSGQGKFTDNRTSNYGGKVSSPKPPQAVAKKSRDGVYTCYNCNLPGHNIKDCPNIKDGRKCYNCGKFGHTSRQCKSDAAIERNMAIAADEDDNETVLCNFSKPKDVKKISINGCDVLALVDSGSDLNIITLAKYKVIDSPNFSNNVLSFTAAGPQKVRTIGRCQTKVVIEGEDYETTFHIVDDGVLPVDMIIGRELMNQMITTITPHEITMKRFPPISMACAVDEFELELKHIKDVTVANEIRTMIVNYRPKKSTVNCDVEMKLVLTHENPIAQRPRRLSPLELGIVKDQIDEWLKEGIIEPSSSDYASPVVLTNKKDGTRRLCVDYRRLNEVVVKDRFPLPLIEDEIDKLQGAKYFTTLDLRNGFFHVSVAAESRKYTAFVTPFGLYQFIKCPFGLCNCPAVFMRFILNIFRCLITKKYVCAYLDDLVVPAKTLAEGVMKLKEVLKVAEKNGLQIKWSKCQFLRASVEYLGYQIGHSCIKPSEGKTEAIRKFAVPKNLKKVQSFLGLTGYFRKFVEGYAIIVRPLTNLLKKNVEFKFDCDEIKAFETLKRILCGVPVLMLYSMEAETELHTDACKFGLGAILLQKSSEDLMFHPVYYFSKKTNSAQERYCSYELEVLAIIYALKKFRVYLLGLCFKIVTDCAAFKGTMERKELTSRIAGWALQLQEFNFKLEHRAGCRMRHVDALSREPILMLVEDHVVNRVKAAQRNDAELKAIFKILEDGEYEDYFTNKNCLFKIVKGVSLLVIPKKMQMEVIKLCHEQGHFAKKKTEELVNRQFYIPNLVSKISTCLKNCVPCIMAERKMGRQECFQHPIPKGEIPLNTYHVDHLGNLTATKKQYRYIFGIIDAFSKFVWLYPTKTMNAKEVIQKLEYQKAIFGNPKNIIADRGGAFRSDEFRGYCDDEKINLMMITTGVPTGNGQVEPLFRIVIPALIKLSLNDPESWYKYTDKLQRFLNNSYQRSIGMTPFELLVGVKMRAPEDLRVMEVIEEEIAHIFIDDRQELRNDAKKNIQVVQDENRRVFNKKRKEARIYQIGDIVLIKRTQFSGGTKIQPKFIGPYEVTKVKDNERYEVKKIGQSEGPFLTSTCAGYMKPYYYGISDDSDDEDSDAEDPEVNTNDDANDNRDANDEEILEWSDDASGFAGFGDSDLD